MRQIADIVLIFSHVRIRCTKNLVVDKAIHTVQKNKKKRKKKKKQYVHDMRVVKLTLSLPSLSHSYTHTHTHTHTHKQTNKHTRACAFSFLPLASFPLSLWQTHTHILSFRTRHIYNIMPFLCVLTLWQPWPEPNTVTHSEQSSLDGQWSKESTKKKNCSFFLAMPTLWCFAVLPFLSVVSADYTFTMVIQCTLESAPLKQNYTQVRPRILIQTQTQHKKSHNSPKSGRFQLVYQKHLLYR